MAELFTGIFEGYDFQYESFCDPHNCLHAASPQRFDEIPD